MAETKAPPSQEPAEPKEQPKQPAGKPTTDPENHDENVGPRAPTAGESDRAKAPPEEREADHEPEEDERGLHYGQRPGSTIAEDNDVE